jgi:C-terminal processing protease CtpA/Prc
MIFQLLAAATVAGVVMTSSSCAQRESADEHEADVVVSTRGRAWLGVSIEDMSERLARRMNVKTLKGALVNSVSDDSPARKAGIKEDDIIVSFNGKSIDDASDLTSAVGKAEPGASVECVVMRRNDRKSMQVTVAKAPTSPMAWVTRAPRAPMPPARPGHFTFMSGGMLGLGVMDLNRQLAEYFEIPGGRGVLVSSVDKDGPGARAGLKAGDVIVSMGSADVDDIDDIHWVLSDRREGDSVEIGYVRKGARRSATVTVDESSDPKIYRFRSGMAPDFDFDVDIDLEGIMEEGLGAKQRQLEIQQKLEGMQDELRSKARRVEREAGRLSREAERAARDAMRMMSARTI